MVSRDWNRIEAELGSRFPRNDRYGSSQATHSPSTAFEIAKTDPDSILKHIEEALQEHDEKN
jgi:hypothetical protein